MQEEIIKDLDELRDHLESLRAKYGNNFNVVMAAGVVNDETFVGCSSHMGNNLHQIGHCLLEDPVFVNELSNSACCVIEHNEDMPEIIKIAAQGSVKSIAKIIVTSSTNYKKWKREQDFNDLKDSISDEELDEALHDLLINTFKKRCD